ncbi:hypothetical protein [Micromonospora chokoriensis]|uniref:hypothetical protein n=1 Tax=Micromonospora chokoriensis TaxID=356851 RepID=UPI0012FE5452|nr:hypothetical protein [Micromonospora chokoriensis]
MLELMVPVLFLVIGPALASDYRGIATKHIELSMRFVRPVSPFRWDDDQLARRRAFFIVFDRLLGVMVTLAGVGMLFAAGHSLLNGRV